MNINNNPFARFTPVVYSSISDLTSSNVHADDAGAALQFIRDSFPQVTINLLSFDVSNPYRVTIAADVTLPRMKKATKTQRFEGGLPALARALRDIYEPTRTLKYEYTKPSRTLQVPAPVVAKSFNGTAYAAGAAADAFKADMAASRASLVGIAAFIAAYEIKLPIAEETDSTRAAETVMHMRPKPY